MTEIHIEKNVNFDNCKSAAIFEVEIKERQAPRLVCVVCVSAYYQKKKV